MDKRVEDIISRDTGVQITQIRKSSWETLEKKHYKRLEKVFRPQDMFIIGGNIYLSLKQEMGMTMININELCRRVKYKFKCLLKNKKNVQRIYAGNITRT